MLTPHRRAFLIIALLGAALDLISKHFAFLHPLPPAGEWIVIPGFFAYGQTYNPGIVFGLGQDYARLFLVISVLAVPIILGLYWRIRNPNWIMTASLGLILGGTLGNLYDRVFFGKVRDFIKFFMVTESGDHTWPLFNIADSCICVGVALLFVELTFFEEKKPPESPGPVSASPATGVPESGPTEEVATVGDETANIPQQDETNHGPEETKPGEEGN